MVDITNFVDALGKFDQSEKIKEQAKIIVSEFESKIDNLIEEYVNEIEKRLRLQKDLAIICASYTVSSLSSVIYNKLSKMAGSE